MKIIFRGIAVIFFVILIYAIFFIDNQSSLSLKINFDKISPQKIYPYLNDFRNWQQWSVWNSNTYSNISDMSYFENGKVLINSNESFNLKMKIIEQKNKEKKNQINIDYFSHDQLNASSTISLKVMDGKTFLIWNYSVDYSSATKWNPLKKYIILFMNKKLVAIYRESFFSLRDNLSQQTDES